MNGITCFVFFLNKADNNREDDDGGGCGGNDVVMFEYTRKPSIILQQTLKTFSHQQCIINLINSRLCMKGPHKSTMLIQ